MVWASYSFYKFASIFQVTQTKHEFPFGSLVDPTLIVDPEYIKYQDFFYDNFEWATLGNGIKWKQMEPVQVGELHYCLNP